MNLPRYVYCLVLALALGLLPGGVHRAVAQVDTLRARFFLLPHTRQTVDSTAKRQTTRRYWLLHNTQRHYADDGNGRFRLDWKVRTSWFFGRVTRYVNYADNEKKAWVYRSRRFSHPAPNRPPGHEPAEVMTAYRRFQADGKAKQISRYRDGYYLIKQRRLDGKMPRFHRRTYRVMQRC
jgi:hypothetical protein